MVMRLKYVARGVGGVDEMNKHTNDEAVMYGRMPCNIYVYAIYTHTRIYTSCGKPHLNLHGSVRTVSVSLPSQRIYDADELTRTCTLERYIL